MADGEATGEGARLDCDGDKVEPYVGEAPLPDLGAPAVLLLLRANPRLVERSQSQCVSMCNWKCKVKGVCSGLGPCAISGSCELWRRSIYQSPRSVSAL